MKTNPLLGLKRYGQSVWLDDIHRGWLNSGKFEQMIDRDGVCGVTSNPAIFEKAIIEHHDYDAAIVKLQSTGLAPVEIYEQLAMEDLRCVADVFKPIYQETHGLDGRVSFEVSPHIAFDTGATIREAKRLFTGLDRPNVLIKVPATAEGVSAIPALIADGVNLNVTLLFSLERYQRVAEEYIAGLHARANAGGRLDEIVSVASFFVSRIDSLIDKRLDAVARANPFKRSQIQPLRGQIAIASARLAYQAYKKLFSGPGWEDLASAGAKPQRLLWASTGTKNPSFSDVKYVEALIGANTITTLPLETLEAYRDHGNPDRRLDQNLVQASENLSRLVEVEIDLAVETQQLEREGIMKFIASFDNLLQAIEQRMTL